MMIEVNVEVERFFSFHCVDYFIILPTNTSPAPISSSDIFLHLFKWHLLPSLQVTSSSISWSDIFLHLFKWHLPPSLEVTSFSISSRDIFLHLLKWHLSPSLEVTSFSISWSDIFLHLFKWSRSHTSISSLFLLLFLFSFISLIFFNYEDHIFAVTVCLIFAVVWFFSSNDRNSAQSKVLPVGIYTFTVTYRESREALSRIPEAFKMVSILAVNFSFIDCHQSRSLITSDDDASLTHLHWHIHF